LQYRAFDSRTPEAAARPACTKLFGDLSGTGLNVIDCREMSLFEVEVPETKPETEWVRGRPLQKLSPTYEQSVLQKILLRALAAWAEEGEFGRVAPGWRFRVAPADDIIRPLVPDIAYLSYDELPLDAAPEALQAPLGAPTVAVEIVSPEDRRLDLNDKINAYLEAGSSAVIVVDAKAGTVEVHDDVMSVLAAGDTLQHPALPGFALDIGEMFAQMKH
jgi:Uma2 family endonuclease